SLRPFGAIHVSTDPGRERPVLSQRHGSAGGRAAGIAHSPVDGLDLRRRRTARASGEGEFGPLAAQSGRAVGIIFERRYALGTLDSYGEDLLSERRLQRRAHPPGAEGCRDVVSTQSIADPVSFRSGGGGRGAAYLPRPDPAGEGYRAWRYFANAIVAERGRSLGRAGHRPAAWR